MRLCANPHCAEITDQNYCPAHRLAREHARGSRQARGYTAEHYQLRRQWAPQVATGQVNCWRCGEPITPTEPWDLGHDDRDRSITRGPEHANRCNRAAAGRSSHR